VQVWVWVTNGDGWFLIQRYRCFPSILQVLTIIRPEMLPVEHGAAVAIDAALKIRQP
jgi:hypothetical protein